VLDYATARHWRTGENPARWRGHIANLLPKRSKLADVKHHAALPFTDAPAFMVALRAEIGASPRAMEFAILTAARTGEVLGARWAEIDMDAAVWTVPAARMKAKREHRVPLSGAAAAVLQKMRPEDGEPAEGAYVFPGAKHGKPLSNMALAMLLRRMERHTLTVHGFRSTFRDWAGETTAFPRELAEAALAHTLHDKVEAAYRRGDALAKRAAMMEAWAAFCGGTP